MCAELIGSRGAEMDLNRMPVEVGVRPGAGESVGIDVRARDRAHTTSPGYTGKHASTGSYIQNRLRLTLPAKQVDGCGAQARGRMRTVTEYRGTTRLRSKLRECQPAFCQCRRRQAERIHDHPRGDVMYVVHN